MVLKIIHDLENLLAEIGGLIGMIVDDDARDKAYEISDNLEEIISFLREGDS